MGILVLLAGCAPVQVSPALSGQPNPLPSPSGAPSPLVSGRPSGGEQVVALVGTVGSMVPMVGDPGGVLRPVAWGLPAESVWLASDGGTFVATTLDGRVLLGRAAQTFEPLPGELGEAAAERAFAVIRPVPPPFDSTAPDIAAVEGDPGAGTPGRLVVETLGAATVRVVPLKRAAEGAPAWLPDGRIAVLTRDRQDVLIVLLADPATLHTQPFGGRDVRSIGSGSGLVAVTDESGNALAAPAPDWLAGRPMASLTDAAEDGAALMAQPSPSGAEIAVVLADADGDAASIRILARVAGWHEIARFELPTGANRAVVSWLAVP